MRDFTIQAYRQLLEQLQAANYLFFTVEEYTTLRNRHQPLPERFVILRHDVDLLPENSATTARLEHTLGIHATYYFRIGKESNNPNIIRLIANLQHEIGYHYEDLTTQNGNVDAAYRSFSQNLDYFRQFYPVVTCCMHGAPRSPYDSKDIWKRYDYHDLGIISEPYLDLDFGSLFYLTDTGRRWDGYMVSVRDRMPQQERWTQQGLTYHSTQDIIDAILHDALPKQMMITTHPQRWTDNKRAWQKELLSQNIKNAVKRILIFIR